MDVGCAIQAVPGGDGALPLYLQVIGLGVVWTTLHCSGMCGPLIAGLGLGRQPGQGRVSQAMLDLFLYQCGRSLVYAILGGIAGLIGSIANHALQAVTPYVALFIGLLFTLVALRDYLPRRLRAASSDAGGSTVARWAGSCAAGFARHPHRRAFILGTVLGFLPCMLVFWVLGLSAASGSPVHGAAIAVVLVLMTMPVLLAAAISPFAVGRLRRRHAAWAGKVPLAISGAWMLCIGLAALGIVPHLSFSLGDYVVMVW